MSLWTFTTDNWPGVAGGFTQRGPLSGADPASGLNLGHTRHADHQAVDRCRRAARADLGLAGHTLVCAEQVHGSHLAIARRSDLPGLQRRWGYPYYPRTDALLTAETGLALMLSFADCCPVYLWCPEPRAIALAHCGWRGLVADLAGQTVRAMGAQWGCAPADLEAIVGPCIGADCYEVGPEVASAVRAAGGEASLANSGGRTHLDLLALNRLLLVRSGVPAAAIRLVTPCTRCGDVPMYSWRRDGPRTGRMAAILALRSAPPERVRTG